MAHYFAFDLDMDPRRVAERCPGARLLRKAKAPYYRPEFVEYEGRVILDLVPDEKKEVWGVLYFVPDEEVPRLSTGIEPFRSNRILPAWDPENRAYAAIAFLPDIEGRVAPPDKELHGKILNLARMSELPDKYTDALNAIKPK
jgi:hypothetical protein